VRRLRLEWGKNRRENKKRGKREEKQEGHTKSQGKNSKPHQHSKEGRRRFVVALRNNLLCEKGDQKLGTPDKKKKWNHGGEVEQEPALAR